MYLQNFYRKPWTSHENWVNFLYFHALRIWQINITSHHQIQNHCLYRSFSYLYAYLLSNVNRDHNTETTVDCIYSSFLNYMNTKYLSSTKKWCISACLLYTTSHHHKQIDIKKSPMYLNWCKGPTVQSLTHLTLSVSLSLHWIVESKCWEYLCLCIISVLTLLL